MDGRSPSPEGLLETACEKVRKNWTQVTWSSSLEIKASARRFKEIN
jgi:hypothetical protein